MNDVVERFNPCNTEACKKRCDSFGVRCEEICIDEIESLRQQLDDVFDEKKILSQRVKELESWQHEREWAARREIERLRQRVNELDIAWHKENDDVCRLEVELKELEELNLIHKDENKLLRDELAASQQRVKELEGYEHECANLDAELKDYQNCLAELAALKQSQGEPVAWLWKHISNETGECIDRGLSFNRVAPTNDTFLDGSTSTAVATLAYPSAPIIPEGWQLVTTERMKELEEYEFMYKSVSK